MNIPGKAVCLRIFMGERKRHQHLPLYEAVVLKAREMHLAGATVLRSPMGFGHSSLLHTANILQLSDDLPMVVEIIDSEEKIQGFIRVLEPMLSGGVVTSHAVEIVHYGTKEHTA